jgi:hypothetical protein
VSAVKANPTAKGSGRDVPADPVRALQHALYRAAKADPGRRFHALYDKDRSISAATCLSPDLGSGYFRRRRHHLRSLVKPLQRLIRE